MIYQHTIGNRLGAIDNTAKIYRVYNLGKVCVAHLF